MRLQRAERPVCEEGTGDGTGCPFSARQRLALQSAPQVAFAAVKEDRGMETRSSDNDLPLSPSQQRNGYGGEYRAARGHQAPFLSQPQQAALPGWQVHGGTSLTPQGKTLKHRSASSPIPWGCTESPGIPLIASRHAPNFAIEFSPFFQSSPNGTTSCSSSSIMESLNIQARTALIPI